MVEHKELAEKQIMVSLILTGMGATPIYYPEKSADVPIIRNTSSKQNEIIEENRMHSISLQNFEDDLEIPAFLRRGYNLEQQYE